MITTIFNSADSGRIDGSVVLPSGKIIMASAGRVRTLSQSSKTAFSPYLENSLLASLPKAEFDQIASKLRSVVADFGTVLHEPHEPLKTAYFPKSGMVSLVAVMNEDRTAEVGLIGNEGVLGVPIILGTPKSARRAITQAPVSAYTMSAKSFLEAFQNLPVFRERMLRYVRAQAVMMSQLAACNSLHSVEQRLARWLLMCQDRVGTERLPFTHEFLAEMLGVKRTTVTEIARVMQKSGMIEYSRGRITILKRRELIATSCECYRVIRDQYDELLNK